MKRTRATRVGLVSLGCPKNLVDSEVMLGLLAEAGWQITDRPELADVIIVNTCDFIGPAAEESRQTLAEMARMKRRGRCQALIAAGCMPQRRGETLLAEFPEIDAIVGVGDFPRLPALIGAALAGERVVAVESPPFLYDDRTPRLRATPPWSAYVKIADGCAHPCTFCVIPRLRGPYRSREADSISREVGELVVQGVAEINLIAQDTTGYGLDRGERGGLASLLRALEVEVGAGRSHAGGENPPRTTPPWIRLLYCYPQRVTTELLDVIAGSAHICHYLDVPFQHADPEVLRRMRRAGSGERHLQLIERIRRRMPDAALRTSLIVGFPGETEEAFSRLADFLTAARFDRAGVFRYSREEGTPAADLPGQVPPDEIEARYHHLMRLQQRISAEGNARWVGRELEVLVVERQPDRVIARSFRDAPEVDGLVHVSGGRAAPGDFLRVRITAAGPYDLVATPAS